jgi:hypothetical protein
VRYGCIGWQCKELSYDDFVVSVVAAIFEGLFSSGDADPVEVGACL